MDQGPRQASEPVATPRVRRLSFAQEELRLISALVVLIGIGLFLALPFVLSIGSVVFLPIAAALVLTVILSPLADSLARLGLPNTLASVIALLILLGGVILVESSLSFLGLGVPPPAPAWGRMLSDARPYMFENVWMVAAPGLAITLIVFCVNIFGDSLRDLLDPRGIVRN